MFGLEADARAAYERFIRRVVESRQVWGLKGEEGWCVAPSTTPADDDPDAGGEVDVLPFWSDRACAGECAREEWAEYEPAAIGLAEFMEAWLPGMAEAGERVGTNWNADLVGREVDPMELLGALKAAGA
ncbi:MAG TPA: DUF2750 domain-containing protein [Longimicrobium sp.]|nr:DUF2750 domain-containing protein [Longimicrobium sp.]